MKEYSKEVKELHDLIGGAYCTFELSEAAFNYWLKLAGLSELEVAK
jgi:hypothetical protein